MKKKGFTLIELMIVIAIIAVIAAIAIPGLLAAQRSSNERNASASLKTIPTAQADFRSNDRDNNLVNDFWTVDVQGLFSIAPAQSDGSALTPATINDAIKLIEISLASADCEAADAPATYTSKVANADLFTTYQAKGSYWYRALLNDQSGAVATLLAVDTDSAAAFGACHHGDRFAFAAMPSSLNSGKLAFIVNQDNTIFKINLPGNYALTVTVATNASTTSTVVNTGNTQFDAWDYPDKPLASGFTKMD